MTRRPTAWLTPLVAVVGLILIGVAQGIPNRHNIEDNLTSRSVAALEAAGLAGVQVSFTGRDGELAVRNASDVDRARDIVAAIEGVRVVSARGPEAPPPSPEPPVTVSPTPPPPEVIQRELSELPNITFEFGSATLTPAGQSAVADAAEILRANPLALVRIEGHTDGNGSAQANLVLSQARAQSVLDALVALGIASDRLSAAGFGETRHKVPDTTPENQAINRRVEFVVWS